jgi:hypothetical protein
VRDGSDLFSTKLSGTAEPAFFPLHTQSHIRKKKAANALFATVAGTNSHEKQPQLMR